MKPFSRSVLRELRDILGQTQGEFAAMIGASKDAVASWEIGRNPLSPAFARRIALATGVCEEDLLRPRKRLRTEDPLLGPTPFTLETFNQHRKTYWGRSDEQAARQHFKHCADALRLLFLAASRSGESRRRHQLPAVVDSFVQWCEDTREDFRLEARLEAQLEERAFRIGKSATYGEWRSLARQSPATFAAVGFKDDPEKSDSERLFVGREATPGWAPGRSMKGPRPGVTRIRERR